MRGTSRPQQFFRPQGPRRYAGNHLILRLQPACNESVRWTVQERDRALSRPDDLAALMRLARKGDDEAYRQLLGRVALWLRGVARRGLARAGRGMEDCEDIVQETLLVMH